MAKIEFDAVGAREFETGLSQCVLYPEIATTTDTGKSFKNGVAWNGITAISESPEGAEANDLWADDIKYATLRSAETFGFSIEAYMYPEEFMACDGTVQPVPGVRVAQQKRSMFGLCYKTKKGTDQDPGADNEYLLHLIYNATAAPSEKSYATVNDSPEAITFSWECDTTPINGVTYTSGTETVTLKPLYNIVIDSSKFSDTTAKARLATLENMLYGVTADSEHSITEIVPYLPTPATVFSTLAAPANSDD